MNYPLWTVNTLDLGALVALIAIPHVYIAHLAVGGGLFLVVTETLGYKWKNLALVDYVKRHTWFFLLLTMVFGGITGVGIWFIISLAQPAATSRLIHEFVFGWATEWVFFIVEIAALLIYHYLFGKLKPKVHLIIGWIYFAAAWLSLVVIHGILSFMLTPGAWLETGSFWDGFFNPGYWPGLVFRTAMALTIAGLFGLVTAVRTQDPKLRTLLARYCAIWISVPFVVMALAGRWYWNASDISIGGGMLRRFWFMEPYNDFIIISSLVLFIGGIAMLIRWPRALSAAVVTVLVIIGLGWIGSFEFLRENARKPWIIHNYMYSNSIELDEVETIREEGFIESARWVRKGEPAKHGEDILRHQCLACHTIDGRRGIKARTAVFDEFGMAAQLTGMGKVLTYMPPFIGTEEEKTILAKYIVEELHGKAPAGEKQPVQIEPLDVEVEHDFTAAAPGTGDNGAPAPSEYVVLCWNDLGMHCLTDNDERWLLLPPANTLWAQVFKRGNPPQLVTDGVTLHYAVEEQHADPASKLDFWEFANPLFDADLEPNTGLAGKGMSGGMDLHTDKGAFVAEMIPVAPYREDGRFNPYPLFDIEVRDSEGNVLAGTRAAAPTSTEMGCRNCHGGEWRHGVAGMSLETAEGVLEYHDRLSGTSLLAEARAGGPRKCQDCHADPAIAAEGKPELLNLSAAMHGFHANYMQHLGAEACYKCHPADPAGATRCLRGRHSGLACIDCHGTLDEHALSLLVRERELGKPGAQRLIDNLEVTNVESVDEVNGRTPWVNEPDCLNCHIDFQLQTFESFNHWSAGFDGLFRQRTADKGIMCAACHNSPHAIYPAENPYGNARDNYQALQYMGREGTIGGGGACFVCHTEDPPPGQHHLRQRRQ